LLAAALTNPTPSPFNDLYDVDEPVTPTPLQRQQQRPLRRTHIEAASAGITPRVRQTQPRQRSELTHDFEEELASTTQLEPSPPDQPQHSGRRPLRRLRLSRNTTAAILYTLEEALRTPNQFTPDLVEENASMSDLIGGGPSGPTGNSRGNNGTSSARPQIPQPSITGSPGIKGPRDIMRERAAREARRKAEQEQKEALERQRAEEEARLEELDRRRSAERRAAAAGAVAEQRGSGEGQPQRVSGGTTGGQRISDNSQRSDRRSGDRVTSAGGNQTLEGVGRGGSAVGGGAVNSNRPRPQQSQQQPRPVQAESSRTRPPPPPAEAGPSSAAGPSTAAPHGSTSAAPTRSSFPHAFERWETLSAHWEGLTSFWIRRLEENSAEINRDPLSQQLSRQVTDLSAAGANLFHAVVELQRLRASSERKFQRWFFETRAEQERSQEIQAMTENSLEQERLERAAAIADAVAKEREKLNVDKQLAEMRRELQISKEEARRAWEELGRREQEERERTASLREGQPTLVGGVQVVPMMQGVPSRGNSTRDIPPTREGPTYTGAPSSAQSYDPEGPVGDSDSAYQQYSRAQRSEPADPFVETQRRTDATRPPTSAYAAPSSPAGHPAFTNSHDISQAPAVQPSSPGAFYQQQQGTSLHPVERDPAYAPAPSEGAFSEEEYEIDDQGQFILDARGNKIRYQGPVSDDDTDEYDVSDARERELANLQRYPPQVSGVEYGRGSTSTAGRVSAPTSAPTIGEPVDYSGQGYGAAAPEWAAVPRHHHPTRLSDVLEEDERSRTSASQISRRD